MSIDDFGSFAFSDVNSVMWFICASRCLFWRVVQFNDVTLILILDSFYIYGVYFKFWIICLSRCLLRRVVLYYTLVLMLPFGSFVEIDVYSKLRFFLHLCVCLLLLRIFCFIRIHLCLWIIFWVWFFFVFLTVHFWFTRFIKAIDSFNGIGVVSFLESFIRDSVD